MFNLYGVIGIVSRIIIYWNWNIQFIMEKKYMSYFEMEYFLKCIEF